jgi:hypothetical protein
MPGPAAVFESVAAFAAGVSTHHERIGGGILSFVPRHCGATFRTRMQRVLISVRRCRLSSSLLRPAASATVQRVVRLSSARQPTSFLVPELPSLPAGALESALGDAMASDTGGDGGPIIIDGKATADTIRDELKARVQTLQKEFGRVRDTLH